MDDLDTPVRLTYVTVAYALMFYGAAAILLLGIVAKIANLIRHPRPLKAAITPVGQNPIAGTIRLASEVVLFRSTFFSDRWLWLFGALFHAGLLVVLLRHLRYVLNPSWVGGAVWQLVMIVQPFGLYGGLALIGGILGFWARRIVVRDVRQNTRLVDHLMMALLLAVPVIGYLSILFHPDIVAVKDFFIGLITFHWKQLPTDGVLLLHLWLVAAMMVALPFGRMLHLGRLFEPRNDNRPAGRGKLALGAVLAVALLIPAAFAAQQVSVDGLAPAKPNFAKLVKSHRGDDPTVMIRNHPAFLMHTQKETIYQGVRSDNDNLETCISCHNKKKLTAEDPKHFCTSCHYQTAVTVDCFQCHQARSEPPAKQSAIEGSSKLAAIKEFFAERSSER